MTEKEKMLAGEWFNPSDPELKADAARSQQLTRLFNATTEEQKDYRRQLLKKLFGSTGEKLTIEPPFHCDYGYNIHVNCCRKNHSHLMVRMITAHFASSR